MKTLKINFALLVLLTVPFFAFAQPAEKTVVKAFNLQGSHALHLDLAGEVEVKTWEQPFTRVQLTIQLENGTDAMLKSLVKVGRYNLIGNSNGDQFSITMPNTRKTVSVGGSELIERFSYIVFVPDAVQVTNAQDASVSLK